VNCPANFSTAYVQLFVHLLSLCFFSSTATPNTPLIAKTLQKAYESFPEENNKITLETIMCDYLSNQHSLCKNPMVTCPEFDLFVPHKCPDPR
jgi:hypothetical protein